MNILIAHSNPEIYAQLASNILKNKPHFQIAGKATSEKELHAAIHGKKGIFYDLAILDTSLLNSGFSTLGPGTATIMTSPNKEDAYAAIKANCADFWLEPCEQEDIYLTLDKLEKQSDIPVKRIFKKRFMVKYGEKIQSKSMEDVACIFADGKFVFIHTPENQRRYIIDHTLDELETKYLDPERFFRINRKYIVRIDAIDEIKSYANSRLKVMLKTPFASDLIVSRSKVPAFKKWLNL